MINAQSTILAAAPRGTREQATRYMLARRHENYSDYDIASVIVPAYFDICARVGVDPIVAIAQMIHETGNLCSWWSARPRRNAAGIGVTGESRAIKPSSGVWQWNGAKWVEGLAFADWVKESIPAHIGRLLAYALPAGQGTATQQALIAQALAYRPLPANYRGAAPTLGALTSRWATDPLYDQKIAPIANAIIGATPALQFVDLSAAIAALPRHRLAQRLSARTQNYSITLHYSGVKQFDRSEQTELAQIMSEARYHLGKNWGSASNPVYGDRYMYDFVVLSSGKIAKTQQTPAQLWHAGNATANRSSIAVHWVLGPDQTLTAQQKSATIQLLDYLRSEYRIARSAVFGHNEWPRGDGPAQPSTAYKLLSGQSECPGRVLHGFAVQYRSGG